MVESLSTFFTLEGALALVEALMFGEGGAADEGLPTIPALIWPHSRVAHLCTLAKGFLTLVILRGLLLGVKPLMLSQVFTAAEGFLAFVTLKGRLTSPWMLFLF